MPVARERGPPSQATVSRVTDLRGDVLGDSPVARCGFVGPHPEPNKHLGIAQIENPIPSLLRTRDFDECENVTPEAQISLVQRLAAIVLDPLAHGVLGRLGAIDDGTRHVRQIEPACPLTGRNVARREPIAVLSGRIPREYSPESLRQGRHA